MWLSVSGDAGARRPHAGGCARSQLCRRSGRSHSCSRSARSCTATRAGSALGTHRCLEVRATGAGFTKGARARNPVSVPLHAPAAGLGVGPTPHSPCPAPFAPLARLPTQRAREASSWKPPGHSHTAPPGRGTQRPLTQRHSSESSSELSSSAPGGENADINLHLHQAKLMVDDPRRLCPFPVVTLTSRGLPQQQGAGIPEGVALTLRRRALGPWEGQGRSVTGMHPGSRPNTPANCSQAVPTSAARWAGAALGPPTAALATAAVVEGEGWPGQGPGAHAIFSTLGPAHVPSLRGTLCGGTPGIS